ncbi:MAG: hypothetical protein ACLSFO_05255, partial [Anaerovoracaceae bacterium]
HQGIIPLAYDARQNGRGRCEVLFKRPPVSRTEFQCPPHIGEAVTISCGHYTTKPVCISVSSDVSTYESPQNLYFTEKSSLRNRRSRACFQLEIKICPSPPQDTQTMKRVFQKRRASYFDSLKIKRRAVALPVFLGK